MQMLWINTVKKITNVFVEVRDLKIDNRGGQRGNKKERIPSSSCFVSCQ